MATQICARYQRLDIHDLTKPIYFFCDPSGTPRVCLRSVLEALRISWERWGMYLRGRAETMGLRAEMDDMDRNTLVANPRQLGETLRHLHSLLSPSSYQAQRLKHLHDYWFVDWYAAWTTKPEGPAGSARKLTPELIRELHRQTLMERPKRDIGKALRLSVSAVKSLRNGTYPLNPECRSAWDETFGALDAARRPVGPANSPQKGKT